MKISKYILIIRNTMGRVLIGFFILFHQILYELISLFLQIAESFYFLA